jgi:hypothetical protein
VRSRRADDSYGIDLGTIAKIEIAIVQVRIAMAETTDLHNDHNLMAGRSCGSRPHFDKRMDKLFEAIAEHHGLRSGH